MFYCLHLKGHFFNQPSYALLYQYFERYSFVIFFPYFFWCDGDVDEDSDNDYDEDDNDDGDDEDDDDNDHQYAFG